jgi:hypothetical protein
MELVDFNVEVWYGDHFQGMMNVELYDDEVDMDDSDEVVHAIVDRLDLPLVATIRITVNQKVYTCSYHKQVDGFSLGMHIEWA